MLERQIGHPPLLLQRDLDTGSGSQTDQPDSVGTDLIANAVAGFRLFPEQSSSSTSVRRRR
ncbi:MAG: hypothetical protein R2849_00660 [Thermomicrobiales bacterium]